MSVWLRSLGAHVTGLALPPATEPNLWSMVQGDVHSVQGDIVDAALVGEVVAQARPQVVIHMAAQALVRESYRDPLRTYATNVMGTANLLQACRGLPDIACVLVVTSDKVYESVAVAHAFEERDRLGGADPYSSSKACAELVTRSFRDSFYSEGPRITTARAGNVIGGGDWSADRLIPDCMRALAGGLPVSLRYPDSVRPWQHVLEPLSGYLALAQAMVETPRTAPPTINFGPDPADVRSVREIVDAFSAHFNGKPGWALDSGTHPPEAKMLMLSSQLAQRTLGWRPRLDVATSLAWSAQWYDAHLKGGDMLSFCKAQIEQYQRLVLSNRNLHS
jgi:CDP-glucose 4,6-dehydratase